MELLSHWLILACGIFLTAIPEPRADYGIITLLDQALSVREDTFWELQKQRIEVKLIGLRRQVTLLELRGIGFSDSLTGE